MKHGRVHRLVPCLLALGVLAGCSKKTETTVPQSWKNASYQGPSFTKLLIIGVARSDERRRRFEDSLTSALASESVVSVASWRLLPTSEPLSPVQIGNVIVSGEFDGVLLTRLVEVDVRVKRGVDPVSANPMYTTYRKSYDEVHDPDFFDPNADYRVETALFSVETEGLVWVGRSVTAKPKSVDDGIDSMTQKVAHTLIEEGLVRPVAP